MKKPIVDYETCIGCGSCVELCPAVFELRSDERRGYVQAVAGTTAEGTVEEMAEVKEE